jgi:ubiquitin-conjugating enzyme E2 H
MAWQKRTALDVANLVKAGYIVRSETGGDVDLHGFLVDIDGPDDTPYEGCAWTLRFTIPAEFPFKSPSIGFVQRIFHPNVDEASGSVCLDSLNTGWIASFTLCHIVSELLPFLLHYPNPKDPLNREAANLMNRSLKEYDAKVRAHSKKYAILRGGDYCGAVSKKSKLV